MTRPPTETSHRASAQHAPADVGGEIRGALVVAAGPVMAASRVCVAAVLPCLLGIGLAIALAFGVCGEASAHSFAPALLDIREQAGGTALVIWKTSPVQPAGANVEPILPAGCRRTSAPQVTEAGDGIAQTWTIACAPRAGGSGLVGGTISVRDLDAARIDALVRIALADGRTIQAVLRADSPALTIPARPARLAVVRTYARLGVERVLLGPDHLLFVLGLVLVARPRRALVATVLAFTLGHSLTLALATLGAIDVAPTSVELAIALGVLALATEIARQPSSSPSLIRSRPWVIAFAFGLLHGFGFAHALRAIGLPEGEVPLALSSFNLGIELGEVAFVVAIELARAAFERWAARSSLRLDRLAWAPSYAMGSVAAYWCFHRAAALFR